MISAYKRDKTNRISDLGLQAGYNEQNFYDLGLQAG
jgi:hypothetical protein